MQPDANLEQELKDLEESHLRFDVRSSAESMGALLADEFIEFGSSGRILDRTAVLASISGNAACQFRIDAFAVHVLAPGAVLTTYQLSAWTDSKSQARVTLRSSVWVHRTGRWLLVFHQGTVASGGAP